MIIRVVYMQIQTKQTLRPYGPRIRSLYYYVIMIVDRLLLLLSAHAHSTSPPRVH